MIAAAAMRNAGGDHRFADLGTGRNPDTPGVRRCGAAALDLAWLAAGRFDGFWESGLSAWDVAAGALILREAGGFISDGAGGDRLLDAGTIIAGNAAIHRHLLGLIGD